MPATRKNRPAVDLFRGFDTTLQHYLIDRPRAYFEVVSRKLRNLPLTNFELGCDFAERGQWLDAIFRFKFAIRLKPGFTQAWYNLGTCYVRIGDRVKAKAAFRQALILKPNHADALFMMASLDPSAVPPSARPTRMPKDMVIQFFSGLAPAYDNIEKQNQYQGSRLMYDNLRGLIKQQDKLHIADLGCGTGLISRPWRQAAAEITGVDFTPAMIEAARSMKVGDKMLFERLVTEDILALPEDAFPAGTLDVLLCCDVAQFLGDLSKFFGSVARLLKPGGFFAITVEPFDTPSGFALNPERGRFGHHPEYVKKTGATAGLTLQKDVRINLYPQFLGGLFIFVKGA